MKIEFKCRVINSLMLITYMWNKNIPICSILKISILSINFSVDNFFCMFYGNDIEKNIFLELQKSRKICQILITVIGRCPLSAVAG